MIKPIHAPTLLLLTILAACASGRSSTSGGSGGSGALTADADGDDAISRAEFDQAVNPVWNEIDGDNDGMLTQAEMARAFENYDTNGDGQLDTSEAPDLMVSGRHSGR